MKINEEQLKELERAVLPRFNSLLREVPRYGNVTFSFKVFDFKAGPIYKGFEECEHLQENQLNEKNKKYFGGKI